MALLDGALLDTWWIVTAMAITASPSFSDALALSARREQQQMWQAAQTVRAHVAAGEQRNELLACLGLSDVVAPEGSGTSAVVAAREVRLP